MTWFVSWEDMFARRRRRPFPSIRLALQFVRDVRISHVKLLIGRADGTPWSGCYYRHPAWPR